MPRNLLLASAALSVFLFVGVAYAQTEPTEPAEPTEEQAVSITFPIAELGGCNSKAECKAYCDDSSHVDACIAFAESKGLMKKEEATKARQFATIKGPGGCTGVACRTYCEEEGHEEECIKFGQEHGLIRAAEVSAIQSIKQNGGPGGCTSPKACRAYCSDSSHFAECREFGEKHGLSTGPRMNVPSDDEIEKKVKENPKIQALLEEKGGPGGCKDHDACRQYCSVEEHMDECLSFAKENELIDNDQYEKAKKFSQMEGPGGCKGQECRTYCEDVSHQEACIKFAKEQGFISEEDAERAENFRESFREAGPGGCTDPDSCRAFCSEEANRETCQNFAQQRGFAAVRPMGEEGNEQNRDPRMMQGFGTDGRVPTPEEMQKYRQMRQDGQVSPTGDMKYGDRQYPAIPEGMTPEQLQRQRQSYPGTIPAEMTPEQKQEYMQRQQLQNPDMPKPGYEGMQYPAGTRPPMPEGGTYVSPTGMTPTGDAQSGSYPPPPTGTTYTQPTGAYAPPPDSGTYQQYQSYQTSGGTQESTQSGSYPPPPSGSTGPAPTTESAPPPPSAGAGVLWSIKNFLGIGR